MLFLNFERFINLSNLSSDAQKFRHSTEVCSAKGSGSSWSLLVMVVVLGPWSSFNIAPVGMRSPFLPRCGRDYFLANYFLLGCLSVPRTWQHAWLTVKPRMRVKMWLQYFLTPALQLHSQSGSEFTGAMTQTLLGSVKNRI